nr:hypothetical protein BHI3_13110 [Bacteriovorax sp. HI3]
MRSWIFYIFSLMLVSCIQPKISIDSEATAIPDQSPSPAQEQPSDPVVANTLYPKSIFIGGGARLVIRSQDLSSVTQVKVDSATCGPLTHVNKTTLHCSAPSANVEKTVDVEVFAGSTLLLKFPGELTYTSHDFTQISLFSGTLSNSGYKNGIGTNAAFNLPSTLIIHDGFMYISDTGNHVIRKMNMSTKEVVDFVGMKNSPGYVDDTGLNAKFYHPMGMVIVGNDLYLADNGNCKVRKIDLQTKNVTTIAGKNKACEEETSEDAVDGNEARLLNITGLVTDGSYLYPSGETSIFRRIALTGLHSVETMTVTTSGTGSYANALSMVYDSDIFYLVNLGIYYDIGKIDRSSGAYQWDRLAGGVATGSSDGIGTAASFNQASGIAKLGDDLYISDSRNNTIRKLSLSTRQVTTVAGSSSAMGNSDGIGSGALLNRPAGIIAYNGLLYFASVGSHNIKELNPVTLEVKTIAGKKE